jgi:hypothetical protein
LKSLKDRESLGLAAGSGSGVEFSPGSQRWHFKYHSDLKYLAYNEYNRAVHGEGGVFSRSGLINATPYKFQEKALIAFEEIARYTVLPDPFKFLKKGKI